LEDKNKYEKPQLEVILFHPEDSIATSGNNQGVSLWEELWGGQ